MVFKPNKHAKFILNLRPIIITYYLHMRPSFFHQSIAFILLIAIFSGCASSTVIQSVPKGAKLYVDGQLVGSTPYTLRDTKITGASTSLKLEAEGYESLFTYISKDEEVNVGAIVGGVFFLVPFLWTMKYKPAYNFELRPVSEAKQSPADIMPANMVEKLKELKKLFDDGLITQDEYDAARKKVIEQTL